MVRLRRAGCTAEYQASGDDDAREKLCTVHGSCLLGLLTL
jgi:hypothetical protein